MNAHSEAIQLIKQKLFETSAVTDLVGINIFTSHFLDYDTANVQMPCIIIEATGGYGNYAKATQRLTVDIYSYSKLSNAQAEQIYDALYEALQGVSLSHADITQSGYIYEQYRPFGAQNEFLKAWFRRGTYVVHTAG